MFEQGNLSSISLIAGIALTRALEKRLLNGNVFTLKWDNGQDGNNDHDDFLLAKCHLVFSSSVEAPGSRV